VSDEAGAIDEPLERVRELCLAFPEATEEPAGQHASFRVRGKTFVWYTDDHHGDGRLAATLKAPPGVQQELIAADPVKFFAPAYLHHRGWVGVRLDLGTGTDWDEVGELVRDSYRLVAPKRLAAQVG
jgi:predicted DNA-binding protein (MmcQ/YjbR family)